MGDGIGDMAFWLAAGFLALGITFGPIGRAIARVVETLAERRLGGRARQDGEALAQAAGRREEELRRMEERLVELEERLDFAERLLTSGRPPQAPEADTPPEPVESVR